MYSFFGSTPHITYQNNIIFQQFGHCAFLLGKSGVYQYSKATHTKLLSGGKFQRRAKGVASLFFIFIVFNELSSKDFTMLMLTSTSCIHADMRGVIYGQGSMLHTPRLPSIICTRGLFREPFSTQSQSTGISQMILHTGS